MRSILLVLIAAALAGCGGSDGGEPPPACTKALYDECVAATDCTSGMCHEYAGDGFTVCTQACDANNPCPTIGGITGTCNMMGICKPASAHECTP